MLRWILLLTVVCLAGGAGLRATSGLDSAWMFHTADAPALTEGPAVAWLRIQAGSFGRSRDPFELTDPAKVEQNRAVLGALQEEGRGLVCTIRWTPAAWSAVRPGGGAGHRAPLDLREAFARGKALAEAYGDLVDAWEIENEPDIAFFADNADVFAAYHKALALGLGAGRGEGGEGSRRLLNDGCLVNSGAERGERPEPTTDNLQPSTRAGGVGSGEGGSGSRRLLNDGCLVNSDAERGERPEPTTDNLQPTTRAGGAGSGEGGAGSRRLLNDGCLVNSGAERGERPEPTTDNPQSTTRAGGAGSGEGGSGSRGLLNDGCLVNSGAERGERPEPTKDNLQPTTRAGGAGSEEGGAGSRRLLNDGCLVNSDAERGERPEPTTDNPQPTTRAGGAGSGKRARVLMAAPGLPPGPYFEQLAGNGYFSYTEGFNFHYYGFSRDFSGVYEQFRSAVGAAGGGDSVLPRGARTETRRWPVFITEWGYSLLDGVEARTTDGRVRQWRYFQDVARQTRRLGVAAPMAFVLPPYFEHNMKEFGLLLTPSAGAVDAAPVGEGEFVAAGIKFRPEDFGAKGVEPWMEGIGKTWGGAGWEASPALAWLESRSSVAAKTRTRDWVVKTEAPSPVVLDFIAETTTTRAVKACDGYFLCDMAYLDGPALPRRLGRGTMVLYNFGTEAADVKLAWPAELLPLEAEGPVMGRWRLEPGERREVPVVASVEGDGYRPTELALAAEVQVGAARTLARWASRFYPNPAGMLEAGRRDFRFGLEETTANRRVVEQRSLAPEEPALRRDGRWLVTDGVAVEEIDGGWRFHVTRFPGVGMRPAVAELPLPARWHFEADEVFSFNFRLLDGPGAVELRWDHPDATRRRQTGNFSTIAEPYFRTTDGKLFSAGARLSPGLRWGRFQHGAEAFGMRFLGRTVPPWRFEDNQPAALVFFMRPSRLPAVFEVQDPHLARWTVGGR